MKKLLTLCALSAALALACSGQEPATLPAATGPAMAATATTASSPVGTDAPVYMLLVDMEKTADKFPTLESKVEYTVLISVTEERETRNGTVHMQRGSDAPAATTTAAASSRSPDKFRIHFTDFKIGTKGQPLAEERVYAFDGVWLSTMDYKLRKLTRHQVAVEGEKVEALRLGKGPFPIPFGQKADDVIKFFDVKTRELKKGEPAGTTYLLLTPKPGQDRELSFKKLEVWVSNETFLPAKISSLERNGNTSIVTFNDTKAGQKIDDKLFKPEKPTRQWELSIETLNKK